MDSLRQKLIGLIHTTKRKPYRCEVEYVESTEKDAFFPLWTTDKNVNSSTVWEIRVAFNDTFTGQLMGYGYAGANRYNIGIESNKFRFAYSSNWFDAAVTTPDTNPHTWKLEPTGSKDADAYIDGQKVTAPTASSDFASQGWFIGVGGRSTGNNTIQTNIQYGYKFYYSKVWKEGKLVVDAIPVIDWNEKPCLYDKVSGNLIYATIAKTTEASGTLAIITAGREIHRVDYIASPNKNVCFNTDIYPQMNNFKIEVRAIKEASTSLFGVNTTNNYYDLTGSGSNNYGHYGASAGAFASFALTDQNMPHTFVMENGNIYCDGVLKGSKTNETITSTVPMALFARMTSAAGAFNDSGNHTMYYAKIWNNGDLVRDYYPAIDETGKAFLFDKVSHQIFDNQGTGDLSYPMVDVEYLQSHGTEYINTGLVSTNLSKVNIEFGFDTMASGAANNAAIFGGRNNTTSTTFTLFKLASGNPQYFRFDFNGQRTVASASNMAWNETSIYKFEYTGTKFLTTNLTTGETYEENLIPSTSYTRAPICLFCVNYDNTSTATGVRPEQFMSGRIYKYWYTDGTTTVDLKPVLYNGKGCMFDNVSKTIFQNLGTGDFGIGKIKDFR